MPLDIASATPPPTGDVSTPASNAPVSGAALLFGTVLDQTIGQTTQTEKPAGGKGATDLRQTTAVASGNPKTAVRTITGKASAKYAATDTAAQAESTAPAGTSATAATQNSLVSALTTSTPSSTPASTATNTKVGKRKDDTDHSEKDTPAPSASTITATTSPAIALAIPLGIAASPPLISNTPFQPQESKGQAMDTDSVSSGELLSSPSVPQSASTLETVSVPQTAVGTPAVPADTVSAAVQPNVLADTAASSVLPVEAQQPVGRAGSTGGFGTASARPTASTPAQGVQSAAGSAAPPAVTGMAQASPTGANPHGKSAAPVLQNSTTSADNDATAQPSNSTGITGQAAAGVKTHEASHDDHATGEAISGKDVSHDVASNAGGAGTANVVPTTSVGSANTVAAPVQVSLSTTDQAQAARQVQDGVQTWAAQATVSGPSQVTVHLHPQEWGQVTVSVTMTPVTGLDGKTSTQIAAHVVADQSEVKTALETHQADLRQSLKDAGMNLDRLTITVRPEAAAAQSGMNNSSSDTRGGSSASASSSWLGDSSAQSGAAGGGNSFSSFAAFSQGGQGSQGRHQAPTAYASAGQSAEAEPSRILSSLRLSQSLLDTTA